MCTAWLLDRYRLIAPPAEVYFAGGRLRLRRTISRSAPQEGRSPPVTGPPTYPHHAPSIAVATCLDHRIPVPASRHCAILAANRGSLAVAKPRELLWRAFAMTSPSPTCCSLPPPNQPTPCTLRGPISIGPLRRTESASFRIRQFEIRMTPLPSLSEGGR